MDEQIKRLYNEIRKEIVKDNLKLMKETSQEYITQAGEAFLDGLQVNGECIEIVSKKEYIKIEADRNNLLEKNIELKSIVKDYYPKIKKIAELELEILKLKTNSEEVLKKRCASQKKRWKNLF